MGSHPSGPPPFWLPHFGPHFFWVWATHPSGPCLRGTCLSGTGQPGLTRPGLTGTGLTRTGRTGTGTQVGLTGTGLTWITQGSPGSPGSPGSWWLALNDALAFYTSTGSNISCHASSWASLCDACWCKQANCLFNNSGQVLHHQCVSCKEPL